MPVYHCYLYVCIGETVCAYIVYRMCRVVYRMCVECAGSELLRVAMPSAAGYAWRGWLYMTLLVIPDLAGYAPSCYSDA